MLDIPSTAVFIQLLLVALISLRCGWWRDTIPRVSSSLWVNYCFHSHGWDRLSIVVHCGGLGQQYGNDSAMVSNAIALWVGGLVELSTTQRGG